MNRAAVANLAEAFYEEATERDLLARLLPELDTLAAAVADTPGFARMADFPGIATAEKVEVLLGALGPPAPELLADFLRLLGDRGHLGHLPAVVEEIARVAAEHAGAQWVEVEAAAPLGEPHQQRLREALARLTGAPVQLRVEVVPALLGGLRLHVGSEVLDYTVAGRLQRIESHLSSAT